MSIDDFKSYFSRMSINEYRDDSTFSSIKVSHTEGGHVFVTTELLAGTHNFSVAQICERMFPRGSEYQYSYCHMILMKLNNDSDL